MTTLPGPVEIAPPELVVRAVRDGRRLGLQLAYLSGAGAQMRAAGASWFAPRRMWVWPDDEPDKTMRALRGVFAGQRLDFDGASSILRHSAAPQPDYFTQLLDVQLFPLRGGGWALSSLYDNPTIATLRSLGGRFHKYASAWQLSAEVQSILQALRERAGIAEEFIFVHEREVVLEELGGASGNEIPITVQGASPPPAAAAALPDAQGHGGGFLSVIPDDELDIDLDLAALEAACSKAQLRDYQVAGVRHLARAAGACLGDDMGLGKTRQSVVAARLVAGAGRVLVLCPASLRLNWEREIRAVYPAAIVGMAGDDRMATLYGCEWVVANYERVGGLVREAGMEFEVMLVDEAHYLKEHDSGRTRNAFILASRIPRRYVITGTPLLNREIELHTLLRLTGHALGRLQLAEFRKGYTGGKVQRALLAQHLQGWMLRRRKDVLKDLGAKHRQVRHVSPAEGLGSYAAVASDMTLTVMPKIVKLRQALEALKTDFIVETVQSLSEGDKIIVFCEYMATVNALKQALGDFGVVTLVGSDTTTKRQAAIDAFQSDPTKTVFIGTTSAAGVGITLTAANYVLFASLPWTPALMRQAEDRAYRLGQKRDVFVLVPLVAGTIDEQIWNLLGAKAELEQDVVEAVREQLSQ